MNVGTNKHDLADLCVDGYGLKMWDVCTNRPVCCELIDGAGTSVWWG